MIYRCDCNFNNDSRDYILPRGPWQYIDKPDAGFNKYIISNCFDVENGGTIPDLKAKVATIEYNLQHNIEQEVTGRGKAIGEVANQKVG